MEAKDMLNRKIAVFEYIDSKFSEEKDPSIVPYGYVTEIIENGIEPVYDFSMDKTHAGVVNGFICHNCGEETLPNHGSCNLGSLNLKIINEKYPEFYVVGTKDFDAFHEVVKHTTTFLDDVVSVNMYPLDELAETAKDQRFIGLGLMGFADLLYEKEIPYGDKQARNLAAEIQASIAYFAHLTSSELGQEKGNFRSFDKSRYVDGHIPFPMHTESNEVLDVTDNLKQLNELIKEHFATTARRWKRNVQVNTIAPTGTLSNISDVSAGLEPNFSLAYTRFLLNKNGKRVPMLYINEMLKKYIKEHDNEYYLELMEKVEKFQIEAEKVEDYKTVDELVAIEDEIMKLNDLSNLNGVDEKMKKVFVTAQSIKPLEHLYMQVAFQEYIDASVSKTINMPNEATIEDVKNIYLAALKYFIKGITIYRDGSLSMQVLETKKKDKDQNKEEEHKKTQHMVDGYSFILDQNHKIRPKPRLETMPAINKKVKTQEGTTYINVSADIDTLSPAEIFISNGHDTAEVIGRLSSVALRAGVSQEEIVKQLKKTKGSYVPEIGKALEDAFKEIPEILSNVTIKKKTKKTHYSKEEMKDMVYDSKSNVYLDDEGNTVCPACGEVNSMRKTEGCVTCTNCGTAKCL
jgi:ribonucleoside-diphosphate reductase alpha chain